MNEELVCMADIQNKIYEAGLFRSILPKHRMVLRQNQLSLSLTMPDALWGNKLALCEAEVGTGKTHAYILAAIVYRLFQGNASPTVISTSTIALQKALTEEYIPQISAILHNSRPKDGALIDTLNALSMGASTIDLDALLLTDYVKSRICVKHCHFHCDLSTICGYRAFQRKTQTAAYDF